MTDDDRKHICIKILFLIFLLSCYQEVQSVDIPLEGNTNTPQHLMPYDYAYRNQKSLLGKMTEIFCKDAYSKLVIAENIQGTYMGSLEYEMGIVSGNVIDKFTHMMDIYKHYSTPEIFQNPKTDVHVLMNAYAAIRSYYNQLIIDRNLFVKFENKHDEKNEKEDDYWERMAEKYNVPVEQLKDARDKGLLKPEDFPGEEGPPKRRSMKIKTTEKPKSNVKVTVKKETIRKRNRNIKWGRQPNNTEEAQYKKELRYKSWAQKWRGFNPDIEGIHIPKHIANIGLKNFSNFLPSEIQGGI
ncbi:unnamed protein product [Spodoptera littoralis]|uniref:Uncharacterized protein n=1 Tax=Spodoptera littoralis TaxID=7109 RepID=A0A9P0N615_SPOLI|nr:unnamed protein product [Spodoptera littoralis]CAH1642799.1 unnamed protein product [Spodoptera littoralis]